jgi:hypothetical protein
MKLISFLIIFSMTLLPQFANSQERSIWEEVDVRYYYPLDIGVKDLTFVIKQKGLEDYIKKSFALKKIEDLAVKVYYLQPDALRVEVLGLPDGFKELKATVKSMVAPYISYALPNKFAERYQMYKFKKVPRKGGYVLKGTDPKYNAAVPEFEMSFDNSSRLVKSAANTPQGPNVTDFKYSKKRWSNSKYILNRVTSTTKTRLTVNSMETDIVWEKHAGFGFPSKITVTNKVDFTDEAKKLEQFKEQKGRRRETIISFSDYKVNKGDAKKKIYRNVKKVQ